MGVHEVENYFKEREVKKDIIFLGESSATVPLAAKALGVEEARIAKTLAFNGKDESLVIVARGTAKIDNSKYKAVFGTKAKMMSFDETFEKTGHPVGGVCPFGLPKDIAIYLDESLKEYESVYPAAGGNHTAVEITISELENLTGGKWIDVCK
ncbi:prolyl-tRNA editing protein [Sporanaerobium hydrogeniformans]|uniref:Prolyl-tRNA editing protein n=2 Tax=Sporanaerobium hydrogeniformans TaxID=3072179 RepID=A0AC61DCH6_9FIRM|nr:prolyl-tRNA editing protein [Sporanaerobium hydrogeniformans]